MLMIKNEHTVDQAVRFVLAEILFLTAFFWLGGFWMYIVFALSLVMFVTGITGFCALYKIFGIDTNKSFPQVSKKIATIVTVLILVALGIGGSYASMFFSKKIFLEDYAAMNNYYKQALFFTGQDKREESIKNYTKLVEEFGDFSEKYQKYHPFVISRDKQFNSDLAKVSEIIASQSQIISAGDLKSSHLTLETVRPIFQDILKRNGFSMLAVYLVDFHDAMEKIIDRADAKDASGLVAVYAEVDMKLKEVEAVANDEEIQLIRRNLDEIYVMAQQNKSGDLSAKAAELKSSFVKVYLQRG
jgi:hypothetical protein